MTDQTAPEPSMDEILASIRRIIAEDPPVAETSSAAPAEPEPEPQSQPQPQPQPEAESQREPESGAESHPEPEPEPLPEPVSAAEPEPVIAEREAAHEAVSASPSVNEPLVSEHAALLTASAFGDLAATVDEAAKLRSATSLPPPGRTLEDLVAEILRPMLKEWLDENLPAIVRARVDEEVARIARSRVP